MRVPLSPFCSSRFLCPAAQKDQERTRSSGPGNEPKTERNEVMKATRQGQERMIWSEKKDKVIGKRKDQVRTIRS